MKIYNYGVPITDEFTLLLPHVVKVLTVQMHKGKPYVFIAVLEDTPARQMKFTLIPTGRDMPDIYGSYVGTFQINDGDQVFHLFHDWQSDCREVPELEAAE